MNNLIGTYITNFGYVAIIREIREDGNLIVENPRIGKWIADPAKCELYKTQNED